MCGGRKGKREGIIVFLHCSSDRMTAVWCSCSTLLYKTAAYITVNPSIERGGGGNSGGVARATARQSRFLRRHSNIKCACLDLLASRLNCASIIDSRVPKNFGDHIVISHMNIHYLIVFFFGSPNGYLWFAHAHLCCRIRS